MYGQILCAHKPIFSSGHLLTCISVIVMSCHMFTLRITDIWHSYKLCVYGVAAWAAVRYRKHVPSYSDDDNNIHSPAGT